MNVATGQYNGTLANTVLFAGRLLLASIFVHEGIFLATNFDGASAGMAKMGIPPIALIATIALQLVAGTAVATGWHARWGAMALGLFCLSTAVLFHTNLRNRNELIHFEKDLAIAGGMFVFMLRGAGALSVDAYVGHRKRPFVQVHGTTHALGPQATETIGVEIATGNGPTK